MTRYSASRGIRYTAPPGPDGNRGETDEQAEEPSSAAVEADGGEANASDGGRADVAADD